MINKCNNQIYNNQGTDFGRLGKIENYVFLVELFTKTKIDLMLNKLSFTLRNQVLFRLLKIKSKKKKNKKMMIKNGYKSFQVIIITKIF